MSIRDLGSALLDLVFPEKARCAFCGKPADWEALEICKECMDKIAFIPPGAARKGRYFQRSVSLGMYDGALKEWIHMLKFQGKQMVAGPLGRLMGERALCEPGYTRIDGIVSVPLHRERLLERGYNQAELLASRVSERMGRPLLDPGLERVRPTVPQTGLPGTLRSHNVRRAFRVRRPGVVRGKALLLVDDVLTTGATCDEVARSLMEAGARKVLVLTGAEAYLGVFG